MNKDFVVDTGQKFISNVLGGGGAIWVHMKLYI